MIKFEVFWVDYFIKLNLLFMKSGDVFVYELSYLTTWNNLSLWVNFIQTNQKGILHLHIFAFRLSYHSIQLNEYLNCIQKEILLLKCLLRYMLVENSFFLHICTIMCYQSPGFVVLHIFVQCTIRACKEIYFPRLSY